ncbi:MAG: hypothetical protein HKO85_06125, partial [Xanthomonadales bacterium]|nr:hypothetical protein [Xanthomonadales bacterium]
VFGALLLFFCSAYEIGTRLIGNRVYRLGLGIVLLAAFILIWAELAVGIFGD